MVHISVAIDWFRKLCNGCLTTYTRSRSLKLSVLVHSLIMDFYIIMVIPINDKLIGLDENMFWIYIIPCLPFSYLMFTHGKGNEMKE